METLKLVRSNAERKHKRLVIYNIEGRTGSVQFLSTLFGGDQHSQGNPPATLTLSGVFAPPRKKETPEERKARLAAITPAQRLAMMEKRVAAMKAKLAASTAAVSAPKAGSTKATPNVARKGKK